jgi:LemA protein
MALMVLLVPVLTSGCGYNALQGLDEQVNRARSDIETQLQRRADLVPNLVATVKGVAKQESTVFIGVTEARSRVSSAVASGDLTEMASANTALSGSLSRLIAVAEAYPELKSSANFTQLQDQLEGTENRIGTARRDYNAAVEEFNGKIRKFPTNLTAKLFGLGTAREYFEADAGAATAPDVKF